MKNQYLIKDNYVEHKLNEDDMQRFNNPNPNNDTREIQIRKLQEIINMKDIECTKLSKNIIMENEFANLAVKNRDILKPVECNILLSRNLEEMKEKMIGFKNKIDRQILEKKEQLKMNMNMSLEIMRTKTILSTSTGYQNYVSQNKEVIPTNIRINFDNELTKIMKFQQKYVQSNKDDILDQEHNQSADESDYSMDNEGQKDEENTKPKNSKVPALGLGGGGNNNNKKPKIPALGLGNSQSSAIAPLKMPQDLTKAKQIQEDVAKKVMEKYMEKHNINEKAKDTRLEEEMARTKKVLLHEMTQNKLLSEENSDLKLQNNRLIVINEVLVKSNNKLKKAFEKVSEEAEYYRKSHDLISYLLSNLNMEDSDTSLGLLQSELRKTHSAEAIANYERIKYRKKILRQEEEQLKINEEESYEDNENGNYKGGNKNIKVNLEDFQKSLKNDIDGLPHIDSGRVVNKVNNKKGKSYSFCAFNENDSSRGSEQDNEDEEEMQENKNIKAYLDREKGNNTPNVQANKSSNKHRRNNTSVNEELFRRIKEQRVHTDGAFLK